MADEAWIVFATFPDAESARAIVTTLVGEKLAACGNIVSGVESIYRWQGEMQTAAEAMVVLKTDAARYPALETRLKALHPYEVPECLAIPVAAGLPDYLRWLAESVA